MTLVEFLTARLDEDEAAARAANPGPWCVRQLGRHDGAAIVPGRGAPRSNVSIHGYGAVADASHMARHDPARVLAEVEAKRRIIESRPGIDAPGHMLDAVHDEVQRQREYVWRLLALPYADHDDYREEWKP